MTTDELATLQQQVETLRETVVSLIALQRQALLGNPSSGSEPILKQLDQLCDRLSEQVPTAPQQPAEPTAHFKEITVERVNIVEPDGTLRLALANTRRSPGQIMNGKLLGVPDGRRPAGIYYFNNEGNECGGLGFDGKRSSDGTYTAGGAMTFDQYEQDQVIAIMHDDTNGRHCAGFYVWDRSNLPIDQWTERVTPIFNMPRGPERKAAIQHLRDEGLLETPRVFVGKTEDKTAVISLRDAQGRERLRLSVDAAGTSNIEFVDESGAVTAKMP